MRVGQLLTRLRDRLDESSANTYTDAELVRYLDEGVLDMFRLQVQHDESYNNCEHNITASADSRALHTDWVVYDIPTWVHKITSVRLTSASNTPRENNIPVRTMHNRVGSFWCFYGTRRIIVRGRQAGEDLTIECSKIPGPMNAGTVAADTTEFSHSTTLLQWDTGSSTESLYEGVYEADWHKNAIIEFTGANTSSTEITGQIVRVTASVSAYDTTDTKTLTRCTLEKAISRTPAAGDTWEMHAEVDGANIGYLVDLAAHKALIKKSNFEAIAALSPDLERERLRFIEAVTPRQAQSLPRQGMEYDNVHEQDPDRDLYW